ncbi:hypothetical protein QTP88_020734 [Uroleucon formosanum]
MKLDYRNITGSDETGSEIGNCTTRNEYVREINENTWRKCFRWIKKGSSNHESPSVLKKQNGEYTKTVEETMRYILDTVIPTEEERVEEDEQSYRELQIYNPICMEELENLIWRMLTRKSQEEDNISVVILRKS